MKTPHIKETKHSLSPWHKKQAAMLYHFASMDYLKGLHRMVSSAVAGEVDPHYPLETQELDDPRLIIPITAFPLDKEDLKRLLLRNPITKGELASILKSGQLLKDEIRELLVEYSK